MLEREKEQESGIFEWSQSDNNEVNEEPESQPREVSNGHERKGNKTDQEKEKEESPEKAEEVPSLNSKPLQNQIK